MNNKQTECKMVLFYDLVFGHLGRYQNNDKKPHGQVPTGADEYEVSKIFHSIETMESVQ